MKNSLEGQQTEIVVSFLISNGGVGVSRNALGQCPVVVSA